MSDQELVIEAGRLGKQYWRDLWRHRELLFLLVWRDILVRYKQTVVGVAWSLGRPFLTMVVFTVIFRDIAGLPSGGAPYPIMVFTALLPWQFFSNALSECGNSLLTNSSLITKVYFPRLVVPASTVITGLVDFLISAAFLVVLMIWYHFVPTWRMALVPLFVLIAMAASLGAGLWLAALTVRYRDVRFIVPFIVQFGLLISPVAYLSSTVAEKWWQPLYALNPMVGVIDGFRWAILGGQHPFGQGDLVRSLVLVLLLLATGIGYFRKTEQSFADVI